MTATIGEVLSFAAIPMAAVATGAIVAAYRVPTPNLRSLIQHFAAGVVFAAVAGELLPELLRQHQPVPVIVGFALGTGLMLAVRRLAERSGRPGLPGPGRPAALALTVGVDVFIDGLLVGIGFAAGAKQGILITVALSAEVLFLGLATAAALGRAGAARRKIVAAGAGLALLLAGGAAAGVLLLSRLPEFGREVFLALGAAALLYLVTEELLAEAHEVPETAWTTAVFFVGFLLLFVIEIMV